ncbi:hypothetical protein Ancab_020486 [Ancistrocladus abbreviatus]
MNKFQALIWLKAYYWDPQMEAIPFHRAKATNIRKEIESRMCELASCLKGKSILGLSSLQVKGSRKQISRILTNLVRLYSFFSSEVVYVLLGFLLKTSSLLDKIEFLEISLLSLSSDAVQTALVEWRLVIVKFSIKEPELILNLLHGVLNLIDSREAIEIDVCNC